MRGLPPLRLLTVFEAVLRCGSVKTAAAELNVTQPAVSQSLRQLEEHVGSALLDRRVRPAELTAAGRILRAATVEGLGRISDAIEQIRDLHAGGGDSATIACSVGFATHWLMPRLAGFYDDHAQAAINVMTTPQGAPRFAPGIDITLRYGDGRWTDGIVSKLFDECIAPVGSPALVARLCSEGAGLDEIALLHVDSDEEAWVTWRRYLRMMGLPPNRATGRRFTNYVQATQAAIDGQGMMLGWRSITGDLVRQGRLRALGDRQLVPDDAYYLVMSRPSALRPAVALIADWMHATADREGELPAVP